MNDGANVLDEVVAVFESERFRDPILRLGSKAPTSEEWERWCVGLVVPDANCDGNIMDFGLLLVLPELACGDTALANGLLRFCEAMIVVVQSRYLGI